MREIVSPLSGIRSPFGQRRGGFSPLSLFASGEEGTWLDTSDISTLFQDTAATTPITASGQTIARVNDKSSNDLNATQPTVAARPSYIVDADGAFIQHDPVDDALTVTLPDLGTEATVAYVTRSEVRLLEDQTISGSYTLPAQEIANFVVIDRALTFAEKVSLIRFLASKVEGVTYGAEIDRLTLIAVNAVDVFMYDTSKDSDGGAWATDYPAQMVIVAEATAVKIYDATDPGLPLHTTLDFTGYTVTALTAVSGVMAVATTTGLATFNLADGDTTVALDYTTSTTPAIVDNAVNDVAMTVLPDAPIDPATGLPVPTIAVGTAAGTSVINDDGTVTDANNVGAYNFVAFTDQGLFVGDDTILEFATYEDIKSGDGWGLVRANTSGSVDWTLPARIRTDFIAVGNDLAGCGNTAPLSVQLINPDTSDFTRTMTSVISSTYNTGWMNGDIKGAFLADTDDTDLVGGELVTNGTFDTDTTGWTAFGGATLAVVAGELEVIGVTATTIQGATQAITTVVGKTYILAADLTGTLSPNRYLRVGTTSGGGEISVLNQSTLVAGQNSITFVATTTTTYVSVAVFDAAQVQKFDNISVKLADADRSVSANGLVVNGTVTRTPVATGAELVAYSGFSTSNYLELPYNPDLDFGTGDFCVMGWMKMGASGVQRPIFSKGPVGSNPSPFFEFQQLTDNSLAWVGNNSSSKIVTPILSTATHSHVAFVRASGTGYLYVNGELVDNATNTDNYNHSNTDVLRFGLRHDGFTNTFNGSLALWRISATAPTADQILKIYNDEKVLFQDNAQATLYGSSDAVTALAFDEDTALLHAGTSAGRSVFDGLRRVGNTTTSVSTAISASGGLVVEK